MQSDTFGQDVLRRDAKVYTLIDVNCIDYWLFIGIVWCILALVAYGWILGGNWETLRGRKWRDRLLCVLSHIPDDDTHAGPHIFAGIALFFGLCLIAANRIVKYTGVGPELSIHSAVLTIGSLVFGVLVSSISFWTLWQTRRLEHAQGATVHGFRDLIILLTQELEALTGDFLRHNHHARDYHRVLLVTTNPYFGLLSFPGQKVTLDFKEAMVRVAECVRLSAEKSREKQFRMEVLCGDTTAIETFHKTFYTGGSASSASAQTTNDASKATTEADRFLAALNDNAGSSVVIQKKEVPPTQFAVIGNTAFEFILQTPGYQSQILEARRIAEKIVCERFIKTFDILKKLP